MSLPRMGRLTAWIALVAMLLGPFAPMATHALARGSTPALLEVCTSAGPRQLAVDPALGFIQADSPAGQEPALALDHCLSCLPIADRLGPPPASSVDFFRAESGLAPPDAQTLFLDTFRDFSLLPRGPPRFFH